jgi:UPF0755 protein
MDDLMLEQNPLDDTELPRYADFLRRRKWVFLGSTAAIVIFFAVVIGIGLGPVGSSDSAGSQTVTITIPPGESFSKIVGLLSNAHLLRAKPIFEAAAFASGAAFHIQSGVYRLSPAMSVPALLRVLSGGAPTVAVTIPEGSNLYEIDKILADAGVTQRGDLIGFTADGNIEGKLFPDTYQFYEGSDVADVVQRFLDNFNEKAEPLLAADPKSADQDLILASILEKEAPPDATDQRLIAGIIQKRLAKGMRLQVDATVCYAEQITTPAVIADCSALTRVDFTPDSPYSSDYNTYLHAGLPPGPIGNPGILAITAALHPASSSYLYYISDPATGKVIYAETLPEQEVNIKKYLSD